jgi:hypothetical protein
MSHLINSTATSEETPHRNLTTRVYGFNGSLKYYFYLLLHVFSYCLTRYNLVADDLF